MRRLLVSVSVSVFGACLFVTALHAQTQLELNQQAGVRFDEADRAMNAVYAQLRANGAGDPRFLRNLRRAQKAWLAFRDAQVELLYGARDNLARYGSAWPMCASDAKTSLTADRAKQLKAMLESDEGDVCAWTRP